MRNLFVLIALLAATVALPAFAQEQKVPLVDASKGIAIKGYDTVAYFEQSKAVKGSPNFEHTWNGAKWLFATAAHRDAFAKDPERYAPQYGGFLAVARSQWHGHPLAPAHLEILDADPQRIR